MLKGWVSFQNNFLTCFIIEKNNSSANLCPSSVLPLLRDFDTEKTPISFMLKHLGEGIRSTGQPTSEEAAWYSRRSFGLSHDTWNLVLGSAMSQLAVHRQSTGPSALPPPHMQNDGVKWSLLSLLSWLYEIMLFEWLWHKQRSQSYTFTSGSPTFPLFYVYSQNSQKTSLHTLSPKPPSLTIFCPFQLQNKIEVINYVQYYARLW